MASVLQSPIDMNTRPSELDSSIQILLSDEHAQLERLLDAAAAQAAEADSGSFRETWRELELALLTHFHGEEIHLFRAFRHAHPEQAQLLMAEHERIRERLTELSIALDLHCLRDHQLRALAQEFRAHTSQESALLFPWAARHLDKVVATQLGRTFAAGRAGAVENRVRTWQVDPARSTLTFSLRHALVSEIRGRFTRWGGTLATDAGQPTSSSATIWVDLASIETGDPVRDAEARSSRFFDVGQHPEARFVSGRIRLPDAGNPIIEGRLELHGIAGDGAFEIVDRRQTTDPDGGERAIYLVRGELDRRDFELRWHTELDRLPFTVGAKISVEAHVEAVEVVAGTREAVTSKAS
jgi:polyisoprenoid-binding protein YceI